MSETTTTKPAVDEASRARVSLRERFAYGVGDLATVLIQVTIVAFLTYFYTDSLGLSAAVVGTIIGVVRVVDALTDLGIGALVDRTLTKHGKARPWVLWAAAPYGISGLLLFAVPNVSETWQYAYIAVTFLFMTLAYTAVNVPYGVLNALITQDQQQRSILNIFRTTFAMVAVLVVMYLTIPAVEAFGGGQQGWITTSAIVAVLVTVLFLTTFAFTKERVHPAGHTEKIPLGPGVRALFRNKYWAVLLVVAVVNFAFQAIIGGVNVYYVQYVVGDISLIGPLSAASIIPIIAVMPLLPRIIKRFGKRNASISGMLIIVAGSLVLAIDPTDPTIMFTAAVIRAIGAAPFMGCFFAMLADTIEYGEWKSGLRTEGLIYSAGSFGTKAGAGLGVAALGWGLALGGYVGGQETISSSAHSTIVFMVVYLPIILSFVLAGLLLAYRLDRQYPSILADLDARKAALRDGDN